MIFVQPSTPLQPGRGMLVMVSGEQGIGKTAVCRRLAAYVTGRGCLSLTGHCYEPGEQYHCPTWLLLMHCALISSPETHQTSPRTGCAELQMWHASVPEVTERLGVPVRPRGDPGEEKFRLLQAVTDFLCNMATAKPVLVVLEDLHQSRPRNARDAAVLLTRGISGKRLLLVGTYRDVEVGRGHPLVSAALVELMRLPNFGRDLATWPRR